MALALPVDAARWRAVCLDPFVASSLAPDCSKNCTIVAFPLKQALCSAVCPRTSEVHLGSCLDRALAEARPPIKQAT